MHMDRDLFLVYKFAEGNGATAVPQSHAGQRAYADSIMTKFLLRLFTSALSMRQGELYIKGWATSARKIICFVYPFHVPYQERGPGSI